MKNPWEDIRLTDYENHMRLDSVYQLQTLNEMMKDQFCAYDVETIMILGIAGGNGLEHIDKTQCKCVYGVDINQNYLDECSKRYPALGDCFVPICADLTNDHLPLPHADLLVANLLIEYIGYACFQAVVQTVKPGFVSCIIQINTESSFVSDSPYLHAFDRLGEVHQQIDETGLAHALQKIGYGKGVVSERALPNGKKLVRIDFALSPSVC